MRYGTFDVEQRTQEIGRELFQRVRNVREPFSIDHWLDDQFMRLSLRNEAVKAQLFRLVDTLPSLKTPEQINEHLREYLTVAASQLPATAQAVLDHWPKDGLLGRAIASFTLANIKRMAHGFVAAEDLARAAAGIRSLRQQQLAFTIDVLGEAVVSEMEADRYQALYLQIIESLADLLAETSAIPLIDEDHTGPIPRVNVSLKLSALDSQFDSLATERTSHTVLERLRPILRQAQAHGAFINFDMEQAAFKNITLQIFKEVLTEEEFRRWPNAGIALQAYLRETEADLAGVLQWVEQRGTPITVRLVKGAYWDYETVNAAQNNWPSPVFTQKSETDANFERLTTFLLENYRQLRPAIATHNLRSIAHALAEAERLELPARSLEFQLLHGMGNPIKAALVEMEQRVRVYTPFGELLPGMAYLVRRLLENTSNTSFLRQGFIEHDSEENLLMNPTLKIKAQAIPEPFGFHNEPVADFSKAETRAAMQTALDELQRAQVYPLVIGGKRIPTETLIDSLNPSHRREIVGRCSSATSEHARLAIAAAAAAFPSWRETPATRRADLLHRVAGILRRRRFELAAWEILECGKQWREADSDVCEAIDFCEFYAAEMRRLSVPRHRDVPGETNAYFYEPRGVAVVIAPWNFPLAILTGMTAAAIVTGNTVVMKPAETSSVIAAKLMDAFEEAFSPPGVLNYLPGSGHEIGPALVEHPDVALIAFTGSREVGLWINQTAAAPRAGQTQVKRVIAEMGGKNAIIIDEDADLDEAIKGVVQSAFGYAGQKCSACSRVIVLEAVYETFLNRLVEATRSLTIGPAEDPGCFVGPVIDQKAHDRIHQFVATARRDCHLAYTADLGAMADEGFYVAPHIFSDVSPAAPIAQEEIFGPVVAVLPAGDLTEALRIANGVEYALTGGFYSRSPVNIERVRREFRVGNLYINRKITGALVDRQPFGGFKMSGIGSKAGGPDYLQQFLIPRTVTENTLRHGFAPDAGGED